MLECLRESYPEYSTEFKAKFGKEAGYSGNLHYLLEHGLLVGPPVRTTGTPLDLVNVKITAEGLDFLADDGGIGAILRTVTVKFGADQLRQLSEARIQTLPEGQEKSAVLEKIKTLPAEGLKHFMLRLVDKGIENAPRILELLKSVTEHTESSGFPSGMVV